MWVYHYQEYMGHVTGAYSGENVHQCEMFVILQYVVKLVIKPRILNSVARQPALTWQAVFTQIVVRALKCYYPTLNRMRSPSTELWHILAVYIMC